MAHDNANVQRAQHRDIEKDVGKIFFGDVRAIETEHENLFAKARDVLKDAAEISWFHFSDFDIGRCQISRRERRELQCSIRDSAPALKEMTNCVITCFRSYLLESNVGHVTRITTKHGPA